MKNRVLLVDDQAELRQVLKFLLEQGSYEVSEAADSAALKSMFNGPAPDVVLLDLVLPDANGLDLVPTLKKQWPNTEIILLTGHASYDVAVEAIKRGAFHFAQKPVDNKALLNLIEKALDRKQLTEQASSLRRALTTMSGGAAPIFQSAAMKEMLRVVERVAPSDVTILITGESGTGKEVVADLIHAMSQRNKGPCIKINCAALPRELIESELFGSVKGAYTGSQGDRDGLFKLAGTGTLLLDEISEMPIDTQSKLLRVLQEKAVRPVGGRTSYEIDCRVIAATNRKVEEAIQDGKLREDLYFRISAITVYLPPLRERREDIMPLATAFLRRYAAQANRPMVDFTQSAIDALMRYDWPGNIRQLQNEVQRAVLMCDSKSVDLQDLSIRVPGEVGGLETQNLTLMEAMERSKIIEVLAQTGGNKVETSKILGIGRQTLYNKIKAYAIAA